MSSSPSKPAETKPATESLQTQNDAAASTPREPGRSEDNGARTDGDTMVDAAVQRAIKAAREPLPKEMSINQAAEFLDRSPWFILKLIKRGELPCHLVGKRRRLPTEALEAYLNKELEKATAALNEMTQLLQQAGLYDEMEGPPPKAT